MTSPAEKYYELLKQWKHEMAIKIAMSHRNILTRMMALLIAEIKIYTLTSVTPPPKGHPNLVYSSTWHDNYKNLRRQYLAWRKCN